MAYLRPKKQRHPWLQDKFDRKPKLVATIALGNKMACQIWAMIFKEEIYKTEVVAEFRPVVKMDRFMKKTIQYDQAKEPFA